MDYFINLLIVIIPSLAIVVVVYIMMREFTKQNLKQLDYLCNEQQLFKMKLDIDRKTNGQKISIPLKFQAYERMALFLERINPPNLVTRVITPNVRFSTLHSLLLSTIRNEYEHNMSQQLYIVDSAWDLVRAAKEEVVRLVNSAAAKYSSDEDSGKFAQEIITNGFNTKVNPIEKALKALKEDIRENFA
ncbi:MAG: hypothetical protein H8E34_05460 [Bacteroidetes bacterium]|nr:hypothetical protein [Bacteroidota bacterium]MBL6944327.1 hypothetical protein [Bacteroidales bacterium]